MEMNNLLAITTRAQLRCWLLENSHTEKECWVIVSVKPEEGKVLYLDAVEEALCFGWIDSVKKKVDSDCAQRLSPRTKRSPWTELNKERVRRLEKLGLMTDDGRKILPSMNLDDFMVDSDIEMRLLEDPHVYHNFQAYPPLYQRIRIDNIQKIKADTDLFEKRLNKLIDNTRENKLYGAWHDDGRLIDY